MRVALTVVLDGALIATTCYLMELSPRSVLLVEDDADVRHLVRTVLRRHCSTVDTAADGEEAIACLRSKDYDVVVLDIMLPKANGFEVAHVIRTLDHKPRVIVLSAVAKHFADRFAADTIMMQKPFELDQLAAAVRGPDCPNI